MLIRVIEKMQQCRDELCLCVCVGDGQGDLGESEEGGGYEGGGSFVVLFGVNMWGGTIINRNDNNDT